MSVEPSAAEVAAELPGDTIVAAPDFVMDRAFSLAAAPDAVWPWIVQLGKARAGWYLARSVERFLPPGRRALRRIDARWQDLAVGDVIPDYGGRHETFTVALIDPPRTLVYRSTRGRASVSWAICLRPDEVGTRLHFRLRVGPVRHRWLIGTIGDRFDLLTIAGLAGGLRERL